MAGIIRTHYAVHLCGLVLVREEDLIRDSIKDDKWQAQDVDTQICSWWQVEQWVGVARPVLALWLIDQGKETLRDVARQLSPQNIVIPP